jgi:tetratricopeptide (TPR) repeat protein
MEGRQRLGPIDEALALARRAAELHGRPSAIALAGEAAWFRAVETAAPADWQQAIDLNRRLTELDPHGIGAWRRYGDVLWEAGRRDDAAAAYRRALDHDASFELDPLKQLSEGDREALRRRLDSVH